MTETANNKRLFLIDAYALIYRSYYAFIKNPRINSRGENTSAILGFVNTLEEVLRRENPSHIAVGFDPHGPTFRHEAFEQYKAQREETPEAIRFAVPIIKKIIEAYRDLDSWGKGSVDSVLAREHARCQQATALAQRYNLTAVAAHAGNATLEEQEEALVKLLDAHPEMRD